MKEIYALVNASPLFDQISPEDFETMLNCIGAVRKTYKEGEYIYSEGDAATDIGLLAKGRLHLLSCDAWGNNSIATEVKPPGMFAEDAVLSGVGHIPVSIVAKEDSEAIFIAYKRIITTCSSACAFHSKLIKNMIGVLAKKNIMMAEKMGHMSKRTTKEKLMSYLNSQASLNKSKAFDIPYNRQELADYLSCDRSALSAEMSKLKADGVIGYRKNHFELFRSL